MSEKKNKLKPARKKMLRIFLIMAGAALLSAAALGLYLLRGMCETGRLELCGIKADNDLNDGVYRGSFTGYRWSNSVDVTIENGKIKDIKTAESQLFNREPVEAEIFRRIIESQSTGIDAVSGATVSSMAIVKAVEDALGKAAGN